MSQLRSLPRIAGALLASVLVGNLTACGTDTPTPPTPPPTCTVTSVTVTPSSGQLDVGESRNLAASITATACGTPTASWQSSQPDVIEVSNTGEIRALKAGGPVVVSATYNGMSGTASFTVRNPAAPVATVTISPASVSLLVGGTATLAAQLRDAQGNTLTGRAVAWSTSNANVASVSQDGTVTAVAVGQAEISATSEGVRGIAAVVVTAPVAPVASVTVTPASANLAAGQTVTLVAIARDAQGNPLTDRSISWSSSNTAVATVNASGLVTAVAQGQAEIHATSEGKIGVSIITVTPPVSQVRLVFTNQLIYPVNISVNGVTIGSVAAQSTQQATVNSSPTMHVVFTLVQPVVAGHTIGDPMSGYWDLTNASGTVNLTIDNVVGDQWYFVPVITNRSGVNLLMDVNYGLAAENRCNCVVFPTGTPTAIGYYRLYSNSVVAAFRDGSNYTGTYRYFYNFGSSVPRGSGRQDFEFDIAP